MNMNMLYDGWESLVRTVVLGVSVYIAGLLLLRLYGSRTLSKFNAFDFVVTIALGSVLASAVTSRDVSVSQAVLALTVLTTMQWLVAWTSARSQRVREVTFGEPVLLVHEGQWLRRAMRKNRITEDDVRAAARKHGNAAIDELAAVVLENDGTIAIIRRIDTDDPSALSRLRRYDEPPPKS